MSYKKTCISRLLALDLLTEFLFWWFVTETEVTNLGEHVFLFSVVKTETASGDCPLQGLLNCLKEIPEARDKQRSPSGARDPRLQEDPGAWKRNSGGKGHWLGKEAPDVNRCLSPLQAGR